MFKKDILERQLEEGMIIENKGVCQKHPEGWGARPITIIFWGVEMDNPKNVVEMDDSKWEAGGGWR